MSTGRTEKFGAKTTTTDVLKGIDIKGKNILITGGTSGLGEESARVLAANGANVTITARNSAKSEAAVTRVKEATGVTIQVEELELGDFDSIRAFADRVQSWSNSIDILILNAGVMACPFMKTKNGLEMQFGCNHMGHFLMTNLIASKINNGGRVVSLSSVGHQFSPVVFEDLQFESREYEKWASYGQSKTANVLFAVGLQKRLNSKGVDVFAVHPGGIQTELGRHLTEEDMAAFATQIDMTKFVMKTVEEGAATQVFAATAPELKGKGGAYLANCQICEVSEEGHFVETLVRPYALDPDTAEKLWTVSESIVNENFS